MPQAERSAQHHSSERRETGRCSMPSDAPRYGAAVEKAIISKYNLVIPDSGRAPWYDAADNTGTKVEIKGAMRERSDGSTGRFRLFREPHQRLASGDGWYAFAVYRPAGRGVEILRSEMIPAREVSVGWGPSGHDRGHQQAKVPPRQVFR